MSNYDALIIGAGAAGLVAAKELESYHLKVLVIDAADRVGGRLRTDKMDGFSLDHGFQVLLSAYPQVKKHLDLEALNLKAFKSGAFCFNGKNHFLVEDVNRNATAYLRMAFSPVGSIWDKLKLAKMRKEVLAKSNDEIFSEPEMSTLEYLKKRGFSQKIISAFFRPFFGGIFLEDNLDTSSRQFQFIFKMFALGEATIPKDGIEAVAKQLKSQLKASQFRLNAQVKAVRNGEVELSDGEIISAKQIIIATDPSEIYPQLAQDISWNQTQQFYFSSPKSPFPKAYIALSTAENALINNIAVLSDVVPTYAPKGQHLISVSIKAQKAKSDNEIEEAIRKELNSAGFESANEWKVLRNYKIRKALPSIKNNAYSRPFEESRLAEGIYLAGDQMLNPSLNAAMISGELAAKALILNHSN
jgi:phytoene dehydrogenase-like protein